jgi:hypothetical protein
MPKHLAIVIAGAVSLGSYEAGVLYEVLNALKTHNDTAKDETEKIYIDVITGASAGGMTAAIAAQRLLYDPGSLSGDETNAFYDAWVKRTNLWSLVRMQWSEKIWHSLLSSNLIELIGKQMLIDPIANRKGKKPTNFHPAVEVDRDENGQPILDADRSQIPRSLWLGMALTNLDGLDYGYDILQGRGNRFQYTRCVDQLVAQLPGDTTNAVPLWTRLRDGAVASGAFPFAFRVQGIRRQRTEYDSDTLEWPSNPPADETFAYSDGGVLQNQPIGMAKNLIDKLVLERLSEGDMAAYNDPDSRLYLFVSPHSLQSGVSAGFTAETANFKRVLNELMRTYLRQANFHDWIMAEDMNQQVNLLDERATELANALMNNRDPQYVAGLLRASMDLARRLTGSENARREEVDRLKIQYAALYNQVSAAGRDVAEAWVNSILTLEAAAKLQTRDRMNILAVTAEGKQELAGSGLSSFVGFFSRKFREHDYVVGRNKARQYLGNPEVQGILGNIRNLDTSAVPDTSGITKLPLPLWRALLAGGPALAWIVVWRVIRSWPWVLGGAALIALGYWLKHSF